MEIDVIGELLEARADGGGDRLFLWCGDDQLTYGEAKERSDRVAAGLADSGVSVGDRVAIISPNRIEMLELLFGCATSGAIQVPLNAYLKGEFLRYQLSDAQASTLVADAAGYRAVLPLLDQLPDLQRIVLLDDPGDEAPEAGPRSPTLVPYAELRTSAAARRPAALTPDDLMSIVYTSGTTGMPKGCMLPHGYYARVARLVCSWLDLDASDRYLSAMPLFHGAARMMVVCAMLQAGGTAIIEHEFRPSQLIGRAVETGATVTGGVGAMGKALLNQPPSESDRDHRLRLASFIPLTVDDQQRFSARFGVEMTCELYGQTECVPMTFSPLTGRRNAASDGRPAPDLELRLVDDTDADVPVGEPGEIIIRPTDRHAMFSGYWRKPDETLQAFRGLWYHTGDYGRFDAEGFVTFVDRKKDALRRRGENVSSVELETAILGHPKVAEVAVHAVPSELTEDDIKACVVLVPGEDLTPEEAFAYFRDHLPYYAIPRYVEVLPELPKNAVSRVMKHQLRARGETPGTWDLAALGLMVGRAERR